MNEKEMQTPREQGSGVTDESRKRQEGKGRMNSRSWITVVVVAAVVGAAAFYGGMMYGESKPPSAQEAMDALRNLTPEEAAQAFQGAGAPGGGAAGGPPFFGGSGGGPRGAAGGFVNGDILSKDAESITLQLPDGGTQIVFYSDSTTIVKTTDGSASDLAAGTGVIVNGTTDNDGSVTAERIQLLAPGQEGPLGFGGGTSTTTAP